MNRITDTIERRQRHIDAKALSPERLAEVSHSLNMQLDEYVRFQELKSLGMIEGKLSQEEAMTIYAHLGNTVEHFNQQSLAVKAVLTVVFAELIKGRISQMQTA